MTGAAGDSSQTSKDPPLHDAPVCIEIPGAGPSHKSLRVDMTWPSIFFLNPSALKWKQWHTPGSEQSAVSAQDPCPVYYIYLLLENKSDSGSA